MEKTIQQQVGDRLRAYRKEKAGLSQEKLARKVGLDRTYYASIEQGKHAVTISTLQKIANGLDVSMAEVLKDL